MEYTPRQIAAFVMIASERRRQDLAERLQISALGAQGSEKSIKAALKDLSDA